MSKRNVILIDFKDPVFQDLLKTYCLRSSPFGEIDYIKSINGRNRASEKYVSFLKENCSLPIAVRNENNEYLFFAFFNHIKDSHIDLIFAFPNTKLESDIPTMRLCFYELCLTAFNYLKCDNIIGKVFRREKKNAYKFFLKRYIKALTYTENKDKEFDEVYTDKQTLIKEYEKLSI